MSDEDIHELIANIHRTSDAVGYDQDIDVMGIPPVYCISPDAVAKQVRNTEQTEVYMMQYVSAQTTIPVPTIRRVLSCRSDPKRYWIIMDHVRGQTLFHCWSQLHWWRKLYIIWTLRRYIRALHRLPLPNPGIPGPLNGHTTPLPCYGLPFAERGSKPFASLCEFTSWFDYQRYCHQVRLHRGFNRRWTCPTFPTTSGPPLVFCHGDLHLRNIILDEAGRVWLLDWGNAGAYPPWWDYVHAATWRKAARPACRLPRLFAFCLPFMFGGYEKVYREYWSVLMPQMEMVGFYSQHEEQD